MQVPSELTRKAASLVQETFIFRVVVVFFVAMTRDGRELPRVVR